MPTDTSAQPVAAAAAINNHFDTRTAAYELSADLAEQLDGACDLLLLFASFHHRAALGDAAEIVRNQLAPRTLVGSTAESVLGVSEAGGVELEGRAGMSALALRLPSDRVQISPFAFDVVGELITPDLLPGALRERMHVGDAHRATLLLADPFTTPMNHVIPALGASRERSAVRVIGGLASGASQRRQNLLILDDRTMDCGAVGVTLSGDIEVDPLVSQGCRPIGQPWVVTRAEGNRILELGGRSPMDVAKETAQHLPGPDRPLLARGVLMGLVANEYKDRFGRGDFVIRGIMWANLRDGTIAVGDVPRVGQTVQFHIRDAETAHEDLDLLLDAQQLKAPPIATLLFNCNGRGSRLFPTAGHDAALIHRRLGHAPMAGMFAAGEIGPIDGVPFLHGHTACAAILRMPAEGPPQDAR